MQRVVDFCREREMIVVHDFAYADIGFDGYRPPSILQAEGAKECAVELYSMTKSFSMAGWRCAFLLGNAEVVQALVKLKSYLDYGMFQPVQIAATVTMNEAPDFPAEVCAIYQSRRDALDRRARPHRVGHPQAEGLDVRVGADPRALRRDGLGRVLLDGGARVRRRAVAGRRVRPRRRGLRPLRPDRERAAHRPGHPQPPPGPDQARLRRRVRHGPVTRRDTPRGHGVRDVPRRCPTTVSPPEHARTLVVRVWLPDRPGRARPGGEPDRRRARRRDGIDILERGGGRAIDELVVALPESVSVDLLAKEIGAVDGVAVEDVRDRSTTSGPTRSTAVLQLAALVAETGAGRPARARWSSGLVQAVDADWAVAVRDDEVVEQRGEPPDLGWLLAFLDGSEHLDPACPPTNTPGDVMWARLPRPGRGGDGPVGAGGPRARAPARSPRSPASSITWCWTRGRRVRWRAAGTGSVTAVTLPHGIRSRSVAVGIRKRTGFPRWHRTVRPSSSYSVTNE